MQKRKRSGAEVKLYCFRCREPTAHFYHAKGFICSKCLNIRALDSADVNKGGDHA